MKDFDQEIQGLRGRYLYVFCTLPDKYRKSAVDALEKATKGRGRGSICVQIGPDGTGISSNPTLPDFPWPRLGQDGERFDRLEKRLQQLQDRLERLEKQRQGEEDEPKKEPKKSSNAIGVGIVIEPWKKT